MDITLWLAAMLPVTGLAAQHIALLHRQMRFTALAVLDVVPPAIGLGVGMIAARSGWGYVSLIAASIAESLAVVAVAWSLSQWRPSRPPRQWRIGRLIKAGGDLTGYFLAGYLTMTLDNVLLGVVKGSVALGLYDRGNKLAIQPIAQLLAPVGRVAVPLLTRLRDDPVRYRGAYLDALQSLMLVLVPGILWATVMAQPLIELLLGPTWDGVAPVFSWLAISGLVRPLHQSTYWLFATQERTRQQVVYVTVTSVVTVAAFVAGLPWGAVGVAAASTLSLSFIATPLLVWGATRRGLVTLRDLIAGLAPFALAAAVTTAVLMLTPVEDVVGLGFSLVLAHLSFLGVMLVFGRRIVRRAWHFATVLARRGK